MEREGRRMRARGREKGKCNVAIFAADFRYESLLHGMQTQNLTGTHPLPFEYSDK